MLIPKIRYSDSFLRLSCYIILFRLVDKTDDLDRSRIKVMIGDDSYLETRWVARNDKASQKRRTSKLLQQLITITQ